DRSLNPVIKLSFGSPNQENGPRGLKEDLRHFCLCRKRAIVSEATKKSALVGKRFGKPTCYELSLGSYCCQPCSYRDVFVLKSSAARQSIPPMRDILLPLKERRSVDRHLTSFSLRYRGKDAKKNII